MTSRTKTAMAVGLAALASSAFATGSASAGWFVGGSALGSGKSAALASSPNVDGGVALNIPNVSIKVLCPGPVQLTTGRISEPNTLAVKAIVFSNCETVAPSPSVCRLSGAGGGRTATVETVFVLASAALGPKSPEDRLTFKPESGKTFAELPFAEETACAFEGRVPVKGAVTVNAPTGQTENAVQAFEGLGSSENNSLEVGGGNKAFLEEVCKLLVSLSSGSKWSYK